MKKEELLNIQSGTMITQRCLPTNVLPHYVDLYIIVDSIEQSNTDKNKILIYNKLIYKYINKKFYEVFHSSPCTIIEKWLPDISITDKEIEKKVLEKQCIIE